MLRLYAGPHDPARPVVCVDGASEELRGDVAPPVRPAPGPPAKEDYEYARHGTANLLVITEPLAGRRQVNVTDRRTVPDFAARMKYLCDELDPDAGVIRVVLDTLNARALGSLFATYPPGVAAPAAVGIHSTPKHASWLNMAECELSVLSRQCPSRRISDRGKLAAEVKAWVASRNAAGAKLNWTFRVADARRKLAHLYPQEPQR